MATEQQARQISSNREAAQRIVEIYNIMTDPETNPMWEVLGLTGELIAIWRSFPNCVHAHFIVDLIHANAETMHQAILDLEDMGHLANDFECYMDRPETLAGRKDGSLKTGWAHFRS